MLRINLEDRKYYKPEKKELFLILCQLTSQEVQELIIPFLDQHPEITTLNISSNNIGNEGIKALAANTSLIKLEVDHNNIGVEGVQSIAANTTLKILSVRGNKIGNDGAKALASNKSLKILNVAGDNIEVEGAKALAANTSLESLYISDNNIGDDGAKAIAANTNLKELYVCGCNITDDGVKALVSNISIEQLVMQPGFITAKKNFITADGDNILIEPDPIKRANYGIEVGIKTEVPSLQRICLFAVKKYSDILVVKNEDGNNIKFDPNDEYHLTKDLLEEYNKPRI